jgi:type 1 glutamine amidotransferase
MTRGLAGNLDAMPKALIVWGGLDFHEPLQISELFDSILKEEGYDVTLSNDLDSLADTELMNSLDLFIPHWTCGELTPDQLQGVIEAVRDHGVGIAGNHGGMCDAFRSHMEWHFMTGGQFVSHPGPAGHKYTVEFCRDDQSSIMADMEDFVFESEQYYLIVDPGVTALATTRFPQPGADGPHVENPCDMPTIWTKKFGKGKVFYSALGHCRAEFDRPELPEIMRRGFLWASR